MENSVSSSSVNQQPTTTEQSPPLPKNPNASNNSKQKKIIFSVVGFVVLLFLFITVSKLLNKLQTHEIVNSTNKNAPSSKLLSYQRVASKSLLGTTPSNVGLIYSPNGLSYAYFNKHPNSTNCTPYFNGKVAGPDATCFEATPFNQLSPDSKFFAYIDANARVVLDGQEIDTYQKAEFIDTAFTPDDKIVYKATDKGKTFLVIGDKEQQKYDATTYDFYSAGFSLDGKHSFYSVYYPINAATQSQKRLTVLDGKNLDQYDQTGHIVFSPNSQHIGYAAWKNSKMSFVADGVEGKKYSASLNDSIYNPVFSPDSQSYAFLLNQNKIQFLVLSNSKQFGPYNEILGGPVFTSDSQKVSWVASYGDKTEVDVANVNDGSLASQKFIPRITTQNGEIGLVISLDGNHTAFRGCDSLTDCYKLSIFFDGTSQMQYSNLDDFIVFSPDSKKVAYIAPKNNGFTVIINGDGGGNVFDSISHPAFSNDSTKMTYIAQSGTQVYSVTEVLQ